SRSRSPTRCPYRRRASARARCRSSRHTQTACTRAAARPSRGRASSPRRLQCAGGRSRVCARGKLLEIALPARCTLVVGGTSAGAGPRVLGEATTRELLEVVAPQREFGRCVAALVGEGEQVAVGEIGVARAAGDREDLAVRRFGALELAGLPVGPRHGLELGDAIGHLLGQLFRWPSGRASSRLSVLARSRDLTPAHDRLLRRGLGHEPARWLLELALALVALAQV